MRLLAPLLAASFLVAAWPMAPAQTATGWFIEDNANDAVITGADQSAPAPVSRWDLKRLDIRDDDVNLILLIGFHELTLGTPADQTAADVHVVVDFGLPDGQPLLQAVTALRGGTREGETTFVIDPRDMRTEVCEDYTRYSRNNCRRSEVVLHAANKSLEIRIQKSLLGVRDLSEAATLYGSEITQIRAHALVLSAPALIGASETTEEDWLPDAAPATKPFVVAHKTANLAVQVHLALGSEAIGLAPNGLTVMPFFVVNAPDAKRILELTYTIEGPAAEASQVQVSGPTNITIPAGKSRDYRLFLNSTGPAKGLNLTVRALSRLDGEPGFTRVELREGAAMGPGNSKLAFFARPQDPAQPVDDDHVLIDVGPDVPGFSADTTFSMEYVFGHARSYRPTLLPLAFLPGGRVLGELKTAPRPLEIKDVTIKLQLGIPGSDEVNQVITGTAAPEGSTFPISMALPRANRTSPSQVLFYLTMRVEYERVYTPGATVIPPLEFLTEGSYLTLPLIEPPPEAFETALPAPFQISVLGERVDLVNPGEARLFNASVLNMDSQEQRLQLEATVDNPAWVVRVLPGKAFDLNAGDSINAGVLVEAPATAKENEKVRIRLNATADNGASTSVILSLTATSAEVGDDRGAYKASEDDVKKLADPPAKDSPGPQAVVLLGLALLAVTLRRRSSKRF